MKTTISIAKVWKRRIRVEALYKVNNLSLSHSRRLLLLMRGKNYWTLIKIKASWTFGHLLTISIVIHLNLYFLIALPALVSHLWSVGQGKILNIQIRAVGNKMTIKMNNQIMIFQVNPNQIQEIISNCLLRQMKTYHKDPERIHNSRRNPINCQLIHCSKAWKVSMMILLRSSWIHKIKMSYLMVV